MKNSVKNLNPTRVKLTVEVFPEDLKENLGKAYKEISKQINVPGFRKGKVPASIIDKRIGKDFVLEQAVKDGLEDFYIQAIKEVKLRPMMRPEVDITQMPSSKDSELNLIFTAEIEIRPDFSLPEYKKVDIVVEDILVTEEDKNLKLDSLRARFGTLNTVDRPANDKDFTSIDLVAKVDGTEVDTSKGVSYQIGSGNMLEGLDEAIIGLSAKEEAIFFTKLAGGDHKGEDAEITVTLSSVKERELPELDDEFAKLASEFDTLDDLREAISRQTRQEKEQIQIVEARNKAVDFLLENTDIPLSEKFIEHEMEARSKNIDMEDPSHEDKLAEIRSQAEKDFKTQILLDYVVETLEVQVEQQEIINYIISSASKYGMQPNDFAKAIEESGRMQMAVSEIAREKAMLEIMPEMNIINKSGDPIDFSYLFGEDESGSKDSGSSAHDPGSVRI